ncbi:MAG: FMN-binding protein [Lachnospiraceae bacterium]|nr:FMN-binding protein [Ruminococcus sp.]MCM1274350.1 FMN-binding protein [Lachnospiraceae bacterium]
MIQKLKPVYMLALIAAIISCLIIVVYNLTYVDTTNILTDKQAAAVTAIYGGAKEDYEVVPLEDWQPVLEKTGNADLSKVTKVIRKTSDGRLAFECVVKGYKNGFDIMVGVDGGAVAGVAIVSVGEETPGLGTNTNDPEFLDKFKGITGTAAIVKTAPAKDGEVQAVTSATFSSKGVASAVNIAMAAAKALGGEVR